MSEYKLYLGDCLEVIKSIPDKSVDAVITDPPYGIDYDGGVVNKIKREKIINDCSADMYSLIISDIFRVLKNGGSGYVFLATTKLHIVTLIILNLFGSYQQLIWHKTNATFGNPYQRYKIDYEPLIYFCKGSPSIWNGGGKQRAVLRYSREASNKFHPAQKPVQLIERLIINSTNEGDLVLDCFMGSGTTGVACMLTGRNFVGIEIEKKYYDIAEKRIKDAQQQMRLSL